MEKNKNSKTIIIIALVIAVVGLSIGFAAYTSYLRIEGSANVETGSSNWAVGFSTNGTAIEALNGTNTVTGANLTTGHTSDGGTITVSKYTVTQATAPVLTTSSGSSVSYTFSVLNKGSIDATLNEVSFQTYPVTCAYAASSGSDEWVDYENNTTTPYAGTKRSTTGTGTISDSDCNDMFGVTLSINSTNYTSSGAGSGTLAKTTGSHPVVLTIAYKGDTAANTAAAKLDGDVVVTINPIGVVYTSSH